MGGYFHGGWSSKSWARAEETDQLTDGGGREDPDNHNVTDVQSEPFRGIFPLYPPPSNCALPASELEAGFHPSSNPLNLGLNRYL